MDAVLEFLNPQPGKDYYDLTGGTGSASREILLRNAPGRVLTIDRDPRAFDEMDALLAPFGERSIRVCANFAEIASIAKKVDIPRADGAIADLGISSRMVDTPDYGASIKHDSRLDMRMDPSIPISAYDLVNTLPESELRELFRRVDEIRWAGPIAKAIVRRRENSPIETTGELAELVSSVIPRRFHPRRIHPATKVFLALRTKVNEEPESLKACLESLGELINPNGVLVIICYSSIEERILKQVMQENKNIWEKITKKPVRPDEAEIRKNPRSRSARLRAYKRLTNE